jgi:hypothetical protein
MKSRLGVAAVLVAVALSVAGGCAIAYFTGLHMGRLEFTEHVANPVADNKAALKMLDLICEIKVSMPTSDLESPRKVSVRTVVAGIDFATRSGWYQGEFTITETRKGTAVERGSVVRVSRPALFQRFGVTVSGEEFTVDRSDGSFHQFLVFDGGRTVEFAAGYCGRYIKAPF